jgi:hypothetical protein
MTMESRKPRFRIAVWLGTCLFLAITGFYLWTEHRAHLLGALPYLLLPLCLLILFLMLRHQGGGDGEGPSSGAPGDDDSQEHGSKR